MRKKIVLIVNPIAGSHKNKATLVQQVTQYFADVGFDLTIQYTAKRGDATEFARRAVNEQVDLVVAAGGDGTVNEVAIGLVNTQAVLGIIPLGSGNGLARSLQIPQKVIRACEVISNGKVAAMDVGKANERYFFLIAGFGFDALVGKKFDESPNRGALPYFYLSAKEFFNYKPSLLKIDFDGRSMLLSPFTIAVANGQQYGNNAKIAPDAKLNDGLFDICVIHKLSLFQILSAVPKLFSGNMPKYASAEFYRAAELFVEREAPDYVNIDGEPVWEEAVVRISILPKSLKIVTPINVSCLI